MPNDVIGMDPKFDDFVVETMAKLENPGLLLVGAKRDGSSNVMAIGWGFVGVLWGMPVFIVAVRHSRFTHEFIDDGNAFTVNVPDEGLEKAVSYCGEVSGREHDKFVECGFDLAEGKKAKVPVIAQCKIHYECEVVHKLEVEPDLVPAEVKEVFYAKGDYHTLYFGRILEAY